MIEIQFHIEFDNLEEVIAELDNMETGLLPHFANALIEVGAKWVSIAQAETKRVDLIGATREYFGGFTATTQTLSADSAQMDFTNSAPHSFYVEQGRKAGSLPPLKPIQMWLRAKGIPEKAAYPIRKAIATHGTIKRFGYKGSNIVTEMPKLAESETVQLLEEAWNQFLAKYL